MYQQQLQFVFAHQIPVLSTAVLRQSWILQPSVCVCVGGGNALNSDFIIPPPLGGGLSDDAVWRLCDV